MRRLIEFAAAMMLAGVTPPAAQAAVIVDTPASVSDVASTTGTLDALFRFALYDDGGLAAGYLSVALRFQSADALFGPEDRSILFPSDAGEGVDKLLIYSFGGAGLSSDALIDAPDRYRSAFFDVQGDGPVLDDNTFRWGQTSFADYAPDANGCLVGVASGLYGLGGDGMGGCRTLWFETDPSAEGNAVRFEAGTISAVPEPQTWLCMVVGFGLVGGTLRARMGRRRRYGEAA